MGISISKVRIKSFRSTENLELSLSMTNVLIGANNCPEPVAEPEPEPEKDAGFPIGNLLMVAAVLMVGGGAAYYFKVYRPKHEAPELDEDDYDYDENDPYGDMAVEEETEDEE